MVNETDNKHKLLVQAISKKGEDIIESMTPNDAHVLHMAIGISGEAGETLDAVKKAVIYRKPLDRVNVVEELGDIEFYMEGLRQGLGSTREEVLEANMAKLNKRYPSGSYTNMDAVIRADKK